MKWIWIRCGFELTVCDEVDLDSLRIWINCVWRSGFGFAADLN